MLQRRRLLQLGTAAIALRAKRSLFVDTCIQPGLQKPKFWFGDWIYEIHTCDDDLDPSNLGRVYRDYGIVQGLFFYPDEADQPGWSYLVYWKFLDGQPAPSGYTDELPESFLNFSTPGASGAPRCH
jgi:hypothetical protein